MSLDPRPAIVADQFAGVGRVIAVTGGKGGIGKSVIASTLALTAAESARVGLLDLDLTSPCDHVILGLDDRFPTETHGIDPPRFHGVHFMSISYFVRDQPAPLRGSDVTNALIELLAITRWGDLDLLVIDMPPGIGDVALDAIRLIPRAEYLVVATSSIVVLETVRRTLRLLARLELPVVGVAENMRREPSDHVATLGREHAVPYLGSVPFDPTLEAAIGDASRLGTTSFAAAVRGLLG
ncbi:MAG: P-loop NTPase [Planctomycetota bacterium]|jgi:ATP-binding protein involved in chromosome partitioning